MFPKYAYLEEAGGEGGTGGGAGGDPGAGGGAGGGGDPAAGAGGGAGGKWYEGFKSEETRGFAALKGWESPESVVEGYRNLEKLTGLPADQILRMPKADDAEGMSKLYERLGKPAKAEDYRFELPKGDNGDFAKNASGWFHKANLTQAQAQALTGQWSEYVKSLQTQAETAYGEQVEKDKQALVKDWGKDHDKNMNMATQAANLLGLKAEHLSKIEEALGYGPLMRLMHDIGVKLGEDKFVDGKGAGPVSGQEAAKARMASLKNDPVWSKRYLEGGSEERAEMDRLMKLAYPTPVE